MAEPPNTGPLDLHGPVSALPGVGPKRGQLLAALGVVTVHDLLHHLPRHHLDRRDIVPIASAVPGETVTVEAEITSARNVRLRGRQTMAVIHLRDETGEMRASFFGRGFLVNTVLKQGRRGLFTGVVEDFKGLALKSPEYELLGGDGDETLNTGRLTPVYRLTEGITQRMLRQWVATALDQVGSTVAEPLPVALRNSQAFPAMDVALRQAHFPDTPELAALARQRFIYEELLVLQLRILRERAQKGAEIVGIEHVLNGPTMKALGKAIPFTLTEAQERAIAAILGDMASSRPMARLLQGDVGCGKTVVALHAIAAAVDTGVQTAFMAPTEVLAEQHFLHLWQLLMPLGVQVEFLTGSTRSARTVRKLIESGQSQVVVGTHAIIQESTAFKKLGLIIIDEQHRFGIGQRRILAEKGWAPDMLQMTATPIPRTLAITLYGALDLAVIDTLPPGRKPIKTRRVPQEKMGDLYQYLREQAEAGFQSYIICPLIEESESRPLRSVIDHFEELSSGPFQGVETALLHGRMNGDEKEAVMRSFKEGRTAILFSTTVIEVGIDVPNAINMVIEDAHQFGLTQLHQLRGRVGRGDVQSYCFLTGEPSTEEGHRRLEVLCRCSDGFELAEEDLKLRGPGEFYGVRQSGLSDLRVADLLRDSRMLDRARRDAQALLQQDPGLDHAENRKLRAMVERGEVMDAR